MKLEPAQARAILESVGSSGVPPEQGVFAFTVGLDPYLQAIREEYLRTFIREGGSAFKLVVGPFGGGKTHFLYCVRDMAWEEQYVVSHVALTTHETPFHSMDLVYRSVVARLSYGPGEPAGIEAVIRRWFGARRAESEGRSDFDDRMRAAAQEARDLESVSFAKAARAAFLALLDGQEDAFERLAQYLRGEGEPDSSLERLVGPLEGMGRASAPRMLRSLAQWLRQIGYHGLVLLFDEAEMVPSFSRKQKEVLINNVRELIDQCSRSSFRGVLVFYAVPEEKALEGRGTAYEALKQRLSTVFDVPLPTGVKIYLERISTDPIGFLTEVGMRLADVYTAAYGHRFDPARLVPALQTLAEACYEERFADLSYKRLFVQNAVRWLRELHREPGRVPSAETVRDWLRGSVPAGKR